jgi:hypothetical protein
MWGITSTDVTALVFTAPWSAEPRRITSVSINKTENIGILSLNAPFLKNLTSSKLPGVKRWVALNTQSGVLQPGSYRYSSHTQEILFNYCSSSKGIRHKTSNSDNKNNQPNPPSAFIPFANMTTLVRLTDGASGVTFLNISFAHSAVGDQPSSFSYGPAKSGAVEVGPDAANISFEAVSFRGTGNNALQVPPTLTNGKMPCSCLTIPSHLPFFFSRPSSHTHTACFMTDSGDA